MSNNIRILILDTYYPKFVNRFYQDNPNLKLFSYKKQLDALLNSHFGTGDSYSRYLYLLGYDAIDVIADNVTLQSQWAKERGIAVRHWPHLPIIGQYIDRLPLYKILQAQIAEFKPGILYCQNLSFCDPLLLRRLKKQVKLLVGQIACPLPPVSFLKPYDLILTSFPHYVERLRALGIASEYFKIGFEKSILDKLGQVPKKYEVVFIGGFASVHQSGTKALEDLARQVKVDVWGYGLENLAPDSPLRKNYHGQVWGLEMCKIIKQAKICVNRHSTAAKDYANNMRLYETTGVGTMLITDYKKNLSELFIIDKEVVTYDNRDELINKVRYYLNHEPEREKIALAGQQRTLNEHIYQKRMQELDKIINKYLKNAA